MGLLGARRAAWNDIAAVEFHPAMLALALHGGRTFYLVNFGWNYPYHIVRLETGGDILRIPPGTFHRSVSDSDGSVVLNQAVRDEGASVVREFRVYSSRRIPRLFATTFKTAPLPKLHGLNW